MPKHINNTVARKEKPCYVNIREVRIMNQQNIKIFEEYLKNEKLTFRKFAMLFNMWITLDEEERIAVKTDMKKYEEEQEKKS